MTTPVTMGSPAAAALPNPVFEGSEKRIEIDFYPPSPEAAAAAAVAAATANGADAANHASAAALGLRALPRSLLDELMSLAACTIVSHRENDHLDAYVLSESSLFVYPTKWVLKTCGTTRLLSAVPRLLEAAHALLGMRPRRACFTRASFLFPEQQPAPHTSFESEARFLRSCVAPLLGVPGAAYVLGDMLSGLQWHVYVADADGAAYMAAHPTMQTVGASGVDAAADALARGLSLGAPSSSDDEAGGVEAAAAAEGAPLCADAPLPRRPTHKLEVCMTGLCPEAAKRFFRSPVNPLWPLANGAADVTRATGLGALVPRAITDDYIFEPCGYSMNGIDGPGLVTVHITPEDGFSYASVELAGFSAEAYDPAAMVGSIAAIFRPEHMSVSLSVDAAPPSGEYGWGALSAPPSGYACGSATCQELAAGGRVAYYTFAPLPGAGVVRPPSPVAAVAAVAPALVPAPVAPDADADADALPAPLERAPEPVRKAALAAMATRRPQSPATVLLRHMPSFSTLPSDAELFGSGCVTSAGTSAGSSGGGSGGGGDAAGGGGKTDSSKLTRSKSLTGRALMASANRAWCAPIATSVAPAGVPKVPTPGLVAGGAGGGAGTPAPASAFAAVSPPSSPSSL
jgi:uncharacterized membrane protein YgcG